jgi:hypothetical protein
MTPRKDEVITFKVDEALARTLRGVPNRSEFIRAAVLAALENSCPLCGGSGMLSPPQQQHWERFAATHRLEECEECRALRLVCPAGEEEALHTDDAAARGGTATED